MKIFILILLLFYSQCRPQNKNELSLNIGLHTLVDANFKKSDNGVIYEQSSGMKNNPKETNFYFSMTYLRALTDYIKVGNGLGFNAIQGFSNISPFITSRVMYPVLPVNPYIMGLYGLNFMKYESTKYNLGIFYELGVGLEIPIVKKIFLDCRWSYSYFSSREWVKDINKPKDADITKSIDQKFNTVNVLTGISFRL
ncbi:MAG: hypothetical protein JST55_01755 [Bacteroidetes bacterium]|nr:hypothetical protein [Bacteroidota bacterium]